VEASTLGPEIYFAVRGADRLAGSFAATGKIYTQDAASQLVSLLVDPKPGDRLLDLCAAPGSKTTHLAALAANRCFIVAGDRHHHRLRTLVKASRLLGVNAAAPLVFDASGPLPFLGETEFDRVLVDAPCSGTGTLRQNPEIKWRLLLEDLSRLSDLQLKLLSNAASAVKSGGRLVYSTCSLEPEEGEQVIGRLLEMRPDFFRIVPPVNGELITPDGFVRTFPHRHNTDGFFAAVLEKRG
jgi:16S rRNA (cytosine967-C5)-methyltransferase